MSDGSVLRTTWLFGIPLRRGPAIEHGQYEQTQKIAEDGSHLLVDEPEGMQVACKTEAVREVRPWNVSSVC